MIKTSSFTRKIFSKFFSIVFLPAGALILKIFKKIQQLYDNRKENSRRAERCRKPSFCPLKHFFARLVRHSSFNLYFSDIPAVVAAVLSYIFLVSIPFSSLHLRKDPCCFFPSSLGLLSSENLLGK